MTLPLIASVDGWVSGDPAMIKNVLELLLVPRWKDHGVRDTWLVLVGCFEQESMGGHGRIGRTQSGRDRVEQSAFERAGVSPKHHLSCSQEPTSSELHSVDHAVCDADAGHVRVEFHGDAGAPECASQRFDQGIHAPLQPKTSQTELYVSNATQCPWGPSYVRAIVRGVP